MVLVTFLDDINNLHYVIKLYKLAYLLIVYLPSIGKINVELWNLCIMINNNKSLFWLF